MSELNIVPNGALLIRNGTIEDVGPSRRVENLAGSWVVVLGDLQIDDRGRDIDELGHGQLVLPIYR